MMGHLFVAITLFVWLDVDDGNNRRGEAVMETVFYLMSDVVALFDAQSWVDTDRGSNL